MKSIGLALIGIAAIIVSLAIAWYFIVYIPQRDKTEQAAEASRIDKQETEKKTAKIQLNACLLIAEDAYNSTFTDNSYPAPQPSEPDLRTWNSADIEDRADKKQEADKALCLKEYPQI